MNKFKCEQCDFFGNDDEIVIVKEVDMEPYGDRKVERASYYYYCPDCNSDDLTEYAEVNW